MFVEKIKPLFNLFNKHTNLRQVLDHGPTKLLGEYVTMIVTEYRTRTHLNDSLHTVFWAQNLGRFLNWAKSILNISKCSNLEIIRIEW